MNVVFADEIAVFTEHREKLKASLNNRQEKRFSDLVQLHPCVFDGMANLDSPVDSLNVKEEPIENRLLKQLNRNQPLVYVNCFLV